MFPENTNKSRFSKKLLYTFQSRHYYKSFKLNISHGNFIYLILPRKKLTLKKLYPVQLARLVLSRKNVNTLI